MTFGVMGGGSDTGYNVRRSLRFNSSGGATYLQKTFSTTGNRNRWTFSVWIKRGQTDTTSLEYRRILSNPNAGDESFRIDSSNRRNGFAWFSNGGSSGLQYTGHILADATGWAHIVIAIDTTLANSADRCKIYLNNTLMPFASSTPMGLNYNTGVGNAGYLSIGSSGGEYFDGYMAEVRMVDGLQLTPSSFAESDPLTGGWIPKPYTGSYGTNGFYLDFSDPTSTTTLCLDRSGLSNHFTIVNGAVSGLLNNSVTDSPTSRNSTSANYATFNVHDMSTYAFIGGTLQDGQLTIGPSSRARGTLGMLTGKWYWEYDRTASGATIQLGMQEFRGGTLENFNYTNNNTVGVAYDADAGTLAYTSNGVSYFTILTGINTTVAWTLVANTDATTSVYLNCGQRPFAYTPRAGHKTLNTFNYPNTIPNPRLYADTYAAFGTGSNITVTNGGFQPNMVMTVNGGTSGIATVYDSIRGTGSAPGSAFFANSTLLGQTLPSGVTGFTSNGLTIGTDTTINQLNQFLTVWQWKDSAVSGFDVLSYLGDGANRTIAHNLGVTPSLILIKSYSQNVNWFVWHKHLTNNTYYTTFNGSVDQTVDTTVWNSTGPTSSVFSLGTNTSVNNIGNNYYAYLFADVQGYSITGLYPGNSSTDGAYVFCGFRPRLIMIKRLSGAFRWIFIDSKRNPNNSTYSGNYHFEPGNISNTVSNQGFVDILSNGFKVRANSPLVNQGVCFFMAFAEYPLKTAMAK